MLIKSASALRNDYDNIVKLSKERNQPVYITRNGKEEMVFLSRELWEQREAELNMLGMLLERERNRLAGARTFHMEEMEQLAFFRVDPYAEQ